jgi:hypothetical protein
VTPRPDGVGATEPQCAATYTSSRTIKELVITRISYKPCRSLVFDAKRSATNDEAAGRVAKGIEGIPVN